MLVAARLCQSWRITTCTSLTKLATKSQIIYSKRVFSVRIYADCSGICNKFKKKKHLSVADKVELRRIKRSLQQLLLSFEKTSEDQSLTREGAKAIILDKYLL